VVWIAVIPISAGFLLLLMWVNPLMSRGPWHGRAPYPCRMQRVRIAAPGISRILVPLDHTELDRLAVPPAAMGEALRSLHLPAPR
jgi:hypothetical protein